MAATLPEQRNTTIDPISAQMLLLRLRGDEIWDLETCAKARIPQSWIDELSDQFESGFDSDRNSIYVDGQLVNQYQGVQDLQLARKIADYLGIDWRSVTQGIRDRRSQVEAIKSELDEL